LKNLHRLMPLRDLMRARLQIDIFAVDQELNNWVVCKMLESGFNKMGSVKKSARLSRGRFIRRQHRPKIPACMLAYLGPIPLEHSSGKTVRRGSITKTGNGHVRRVLVEAGWSYRMPARKSIILLKRQQGLPKSVCDISWKAQTPLCACYRRLIARGKSRQNAVTAIARELGAFIWAIDKQMQLALA
jgi:transposase